MRKCIFVLFLFFIGCSSFTIRTAPVRQYCLTSHCNSCHSNWNMPHYYPYYRPFEHRHNFYKQYKEFQKQEPKKETNKKRDSGQRQEREHGRK